MENKENQEDKGYLLLKWGTLKGWGHRTQKAKDAMREYIDIGVSMSTMMQKDTPRQKELICIMIDECQGSVMNDWDGTDYTNDKQKAKDYIMNYGR